MNSYEQELKRELALMVIAITLILLIAWVTLLVLHAQTITTTGRVESITQTDCTNRYHITISGKRYYVKGLVGDIAVGDTVEIEHNGWSEVTTITEVE